MDITLDKKSTTEASIKITLKESDYQLKVEEKVKDYAKKANIKGFRPGKVPSGLIRKMYGKSILVEEVNHLLSHSLTDYIKDNKLKILGEPLPDMDKASTIDWDGQKEFEFDYNIGLVDEFECDLNKKQKVKSYTIELDDKTLTETLDNLKNQFGEISNPESSEATDAIHGEFKIEGKEEATLGLLPIEKVEKKAQKQFVGVKKDDVISFDISKAVKDEDLATRLLGVTQEALKEYKGEVELTVKNINRTSPAELNQDFFDKVFGKDAVTTEEEFINKVKDTVSSNYQRECDFLLERDIKEHFLDKTKIDTPDEFLKQWLLRSNEGKVSEEDIAKEYEQYLKELKWDLIKNKISEENEIKVENEEIVEKAKEMLLAQLGGAGMAEQLKDQLDAFADNYLKGENGENYFKVFNQVKSEKILDFIKESITLTNKKIGVDEFKNIVNN